MKVVSVAQMRALEAHAFASNISEAKLQERAGHAVAEEILALRGDGRVVVVVGHGNNGRDGAVAAEWLLRHGVGCDLVLAPRHAVTPDELSRVRTLGGSVLASGDEAGVRSALKTAHVVVDAIAGIGTHGALREPLASLVRVVNEADAHTVALDIPSGIDPDTGEVPGDAVWADTTVTLGALKQGLLRFPAAEQVGTLIARDIGLDDRDLPIGVLDPDALGEVVPRRPLGAHKYRFGRTLVVAGSDHFLGAPVLCATGAARVGSGLVTVGSTRDVRVNVAAHLPEATFTSSDIALDAAALEPYVQSHNAMVIGPGLGRGPEVTRFVEALLRARQHMAVIDADALVALSQLERWADLVDENVVLTPHLGELERLAGEVGEPLWEHASRLAQQWRCVLLAKGPFTCVAGPDGRVDVWPHANPALATGGTGDVLAGICGGLLAQGLSAWDAARLAVAIHATSAQRITRLRQWRTLLASDLPAEIPAVLEALTRPR